MGIADANVPWEAVGMDLILFGDCRSGLVVVRITHDNECMLRLPVIWGWGKYCVRLDRVRVVVCMYLTPLKLVLG